MLALPIDAFVERIREHVRHSRAVVVVAQPGAGKTTRVPVALVEDGPVILLQPRRVAARAIAARIADEQGWSLGREVGWQVRYERRFDADTQLLVVTEGVLTARLQGDPLLSEFRTVVFDEFHERSIHGDLAIALAKQAWRARDDLRMVVMSATLDAAPVSAFLDDCPIVDVPGQLHPLAIAYEPERTVADAAIDVLEDSSGDVLCFLPGAAEIRRTVDDLGRRLSGRGVECIPLYGSLDAAAQDVAMRLSARRRIVVATNIAETSVTVPGVRAVVDSGLQKTARYDPQRAIDSLDLERITRDAADQRAGRAARLGPGVVRRLWSERDHLRPHREPDMYRVDLSGPLLEVIAAGWDPRRFEWFEAPKPDALERGMALLVRLGLVAGVTLTAMGQRAHRIPVHPRLARALIAAGGSREMARAVALLSERHLLPPRRAATSSDLLSAIDDWPSMPANVQRAARDVQTIMAAEETSTLTAPVLPTDSGVTPSSTANNGLAEAAFLKAILAGYPDRVAERREPGSSRVRLSSGAGAVLGPESGVVAGEFFVALDVQAVAPPARTGAAGRPRVPQFEPNDARVRLASLVEREWLRPTTSERVHRFDAESGTVKAVMVERYDALVLSEKPTSPDSEVVAALLAEAWLLRGPGDADERLVRRLRFAGREIDLGDVVRSAAYSARTLNDIRIANALASNIVSSLERDAPEVLAVPSGRRVPIEYAADGTVSVAVKLQELFGLAETPRIGSRREPVLLALLAPNGRPVQLTRDLGSFWNRTYPEVRKELRGRYPKHPWPEAPWNAPPTGRVQRKQRGQ